MNTIDNSRHSWQKDMGYLKLDGASRSGKLFNSDQHTTKW